MLDDVRDGSITEDLAREAFGVVVVDDAVEERETATLRGQLAAERTQVPA